MIQHLCKIHILLNGVGDVVPKGRIQGRVLGPIDGREDVLEPSPPAGNDGVDADREGGADDGDAAQEPGRGLGAGRDEDVGGEGDGVAGRYLCVIMSAYIWNYRRGVFGWYRPRT